MSHKKRPPTRSEPLRLFHQVGWGERLGRLGKRLAPGLARIGVRRPALFAYATMYLEVILGKGAGAGWDLRGEVSVALRFIRGLNPVVLDVGAHEGNWTRALLSVRPASRVTQFEPALVNVELLRRSLPPNVDLVEAAVSDRSGEIDFYTASTSDLGSVHARRESIFADRYYAVTSVPAVTLDDEIQQRGLTRVDFLKLDIEGHELAALRGGLRSLEAGIIRALSFEFGSGNINSRTFFHDYWDLLSPLGYQIYRICPGGHLLPISRYYEDLEHFRNVSNYVASLEAPSCP